MACSAVIGNGLAIGLRVETSTCRSAIALHSGLWAGGRLRVLVTGQARLTSRIIATLTAEDGPNQVAELVGCELVALDIGHQSPPSINDGGVQRMIHEPFIWEIVHPKHVANVLHVRYGASQKVPRGRVGVPSPGIFGENIRAVSLWVESNGEQN